MSHKKTFRAGWQSQNLARFLLYKFAFLAEPVQVADDIGIDYFCTIFDTQKRGPDADLIPKSSFAIQIKSIGRAKVIHLTKYLPYLAALEIPYFIGIVNRLNLSLSIYSGELLPALFAYRGLPKTLKAELCENSKLKADYSNWHKELSKGSYNLLFPKVADISAGIDENKIEKEVKAIKSRCTVMQKNLAAIMNKEFILRSAIDDRYLLFAGQESYRYCENNFLERLIEVFYNLNWAYSAIPQEKQKIEKKYLLFEKIYEELRQYLSDNRLPNIVEDTYLQAKRNIRK